jgi:hypothetical protein
MKKHSPALAAAAVPLIVTPAVLQASRAKGSVFGMSPQFWAGFTMGLGIVLLIVAVAASIKKPDAE